MSKKLEKLIQQNRENLDTLEPRPELWDKIQSQLPGGGPGNGPDGGSNGGGGGGASAGVKIGAVAKWAAAVVTAAVVGSGLFFAFNEGGPETKPDTVLEPGTGLVTGDVPPVQEARTLLVNPPLPEHDLPFMTFSFPAEKGKTIRLDNGTIIEVPPHTFVDKDGKPITGPVDLKYREFHDAEDILFSGITMKYHHGDSLEDFQTAGMNEIHGSQNGEEIFFAEGKSIGITMASFTGEKGHRLYYLDQESGAGWTDIGQAEIRTNQKKIQALEDMPVLPPEPKKPVKASETEHVLGFTVNYEDFPEIREYKDVQWEYQDVAQLNANQWIFGEAWSDVLLKPHPSKEGSYTLELTNKRKNFTTEVRPILDGEDYEKALAKFNKKLAAYNEARAERKEIEQWAGVQADLGRYFEVERWGTYNCDRYLRMDGVIRPKARIALKNGQPIPEDVIVYHITGQNRAIIPFEGPKQKVLPFSFTEANALVVILPGMKWAVFSPDDFRGLDQAKIRKEKEVTFALRTVEQQIESPDHLRIVLGI